MNGERPQFENEFKQRADQWVAKQGPLFRITHARSLGHVLSGVVGMIGRAMVVILLVGVIVWFFMRSQAGSEHNKEMVSALVKRGTGAVEVEMEGLAYEDVSMRDAKLRIGTLELNAVDGGLFQGEAEGKGVLLSPVDLLDSRSGEFSITNVQVNALTLELASGERAQKAYAEILQRAETAGLTELQIHELNITWGGDNGGKMKGTKLDLKHVNSQWEATFTGGKISTGAFQGAEIDKIVMLCDAEGFTVKSSRLNAFGGEVAVQGRYHLGGAGGLRGEMALNHVRLLDFLPECDAWLDGRVSLKGSVHGLLGEVGELQCDFKLDFSDEDQLIMRDEFAILKVLSQVDLAHAYRKLVLNKASGRVMWKGGVIGLSDIYLGNSDGIELRGGSEITIDNKVDRGDDVRVQSTMEEDDLARAFSSHAGVTPETHATLKIIEDTGRAFPMKGEFQIILPESYFKSTPKLLELLEESADGKGRVILVPHDGPMRDFTKDSADKLKSLLPKS